MIGAAPRRTHRAAGRLPMRAAGADLGAVRAPAVVRRPRYPASRCSGCCASARRRPARSRCAPRRSAPSCSSRRIHAEEAPCRSCSTCSTSSDDHRAGRHDAARADRGDRARRRHGGDRAPAHHQLSHARCRCSAASAATSSGVLHLRKVLARCAPARSTAKAIDELLDEPYFVPATHAGARAAAVLPGKPRAHRPGGGRVRRADGPGDAGGHHRGDHRRVHHLAAFGSAGARLGRGRHGDRRRRDGRCARSTARSAWRCRPTGPKTLNGLILEHLQDIPEATSRSRSPACRWRSCSAQDRAMKTVRLFRPRDASRRRERRRLR